MKRLFLCLVFVLALGGCSHVNEQDIEQKVLAQYNAQLQERKAGFTCTKVDLVPDGNNKLTGFADLTNGTQMKVDVTIDPVTGKFVYGVTSP